MFFVVFVMETVLFCECAVYTTCKLLFSSWFEITQECVFELGVCLIALSLRVAVIGSRDAWLRKKMLKIVEKNKM